MRTTMKLVLVVSAVIIAAPAIGGEVTGNGTPIDINARSECAFSGRNDTPEGIPGFDPGGLVQNYGQYIELDWWDAQDADPQNGGFPPIPGYACNPNLGVDLHADG